MFVKAPCSFEASSATSLSQLLFSVSSTEKTEQDIASLDSSVPRSMTSDRITTMNTTNTTLPIRRCSVSEMELESNVLDLESPLNQTDSSEPLPVPDTPFATDHWGFPLALFTKVCAPSSCESYYLPNFPMKQTMCRCVVAMENRLCLCA